MQRCQIPECPFTKDGKCLEGRGPSCPNLISEPDIPSTETQDLSSADVKNTVKIVLEDLPGTEPLDLSEARHFSQRGRAVVVVLAGMRESGKTSLLARIHQMFLAGPVAGFDFAGSRSLPRLEELNWFATIESQVAQPKMLRSSAQYDGSFIHLRLRSSDGGPAVDMLLNDISGETLERAVEVQSVCDNLLYLPRADHLVVLIDSASLASPDLRYNHINQVNDFLQRIIQGGQCGIQTALHVVIAKLDELKDNNAVADAVEAQITANFESKFGSIDCCRVAARPMNGTEPTTAPIAELFASLIKETHRYPMVPTIPLAREGWPRDFCRYGI